MRRGGPWNCLDRPSGRGLGGLHCKLTGRVRTRESRQLLERFLSTAVNRIDAKGRVSVPARFRAVVQKRGYQELYALKALDRPAMEVGGLDLLDRFEQRIATEDPLLQLADDLSYHVHGDSEFLKLDQEGRITLTDFIREHTGITMDVAFVGRGTFFQMWEPGRLAAYGASVRDRLIRHRQQLSAGAGSGGTE